MATRSGNAAPVIKRITLSEGGGHHGGAWKVAYADFVTAMMAFFLLMWLLNATTEQQRAGLADYFSPTVVRSLSGTGDKGSSQGDGAGQPLDVQNDGQPSPMEELNRHLQDELAGIGAESMQKANILRHVVTRVTDEGLVIELTDLVGKPLFKQETAQPNAALRDLADILSRVLSRTRNEIAINGYVRSYPVVLADSPEWKLSTGRANVVREMLQNAGFNSNRIQRVTGFADRRSTPANPAAASNNRIEVILLNQHR
ncbi:flagellar motor protein MotB [Paracoccus aerodenitrificans]|uniref:flagellar motor protein MotB n=1 Tax=Paracoccus aerodenitrificans TaxID=3017781 RepID=UPI0022EFE411|nr:flagellar motor protein MotB [Paracoccus aerodenitrificans]WBU63872.1 OmpA family protein [Paracoccus aerodenitrificans]